MSPDSGLVLLTGASGYVGGRLLRALEARGQRLRCLARRPEFLVPRAGPSTDVVRGDVLDAFSLGRALAGVRAAYYLVHSLGASGSFESRDREAAMNFARAAAANGVHRIIYLGGLGDSGSVLSSHLRSRQEVGEILRAGPVPTIEFRASIIIGSGSVSFEMVRALVERLPVLITPRWVSTLAQPIAISDVVEYLCAALDLPGDASRVFEIGGADRVSYLDLMREYARRRQLRRWFLRVPVLTPRLSSLWLGLVTPVYARVGRKLIDGVRNPTAVRDPAALEAFPIRPMSMRDAIEAALRYEDREAASSRWSDSVASSGGRHSWGGVRFGSRIVDSRVVRVPAPPACAFAPIRRIGGRTGWYGVGMLWRLRGYLDLLVGGVGLRRGRSDPESLAPGDTVDFWRVEACEPDRRLRLLAEMRLPGRAWLEFEVKGEGGTSTVRQTATFDPVGLLGLAYWYALYPLHHFVFSRMLRGIAAAGEREGLLAARGAAPVGGGETGGGDG